MNLSLIGWSEHLLVTHTVNFTDLKGQYDLRLPRRSSPSPFRTLPKRDIADITALSREEDFVESEGRAAAYHAKRASTTLKRSNTDDGSSRVVLEDSADTDKTNSSPPKNHKNLLDLPLSASRTKPIYGNSPTRQSRWGWKHKKGEGEDKDSESSSRGSTSVEAKKKRRSSVSNTASNSRTPTNLPIKDGVIQEQMTTRKKIEAGILGWMRYRVCALFL